MGMFDWYEPAEAPVCRECGEAMTACQGKDGPSWLLVWREGGRSPIEQQTHDPIDDLDRTAALSRFEFSCWCPNDHATDLLGVVEDGIWVRTTFVQ